MPKLIENTLIGGRVRLAGEEISEADAKNVRPEVFAPEAPLATPKAEDPAAEQPDPEADPDAQEEDPSADSDPDSEPASEPEPAPKQTRRRGSKTQN